MNGPRSSRKLTDEEASAKEREIRQWLAANHADKTPDEQEIIGAIRYLEVTGNAPGWAAKPKEQAA